MEGVVLHPCRKHRARTAAVGKAAARRPASCGREVRLAVVDVVALLRRMTGKAWPERWGGCPLHARHESRRNYGVKASGVAGSAVATAAAAPAAAEAAGAASVAAAVRVPERRCRGSGPKFWAGRRIGSQPVGKRMAQSPTSRALAARKLAMATLTHHWARAKCCGSAGFPPVPAHFGMDLAFLH